MIYKIAARYIRQSKFLSTTIILLLTSAVFIGVTMASSVYVKMRKYVDLAPYINQNGVFLMSIYYQSPDDILLRDAEELREYFPEVKNVLCLEHLWEPSVVETGERSQVWCYSKEVTDMLHPEMSEGHWFTKTDMEADTLHAVVTYNGGRYKVGDQVAFKSDLSNAQITVQISGVLENGVNLYYNDGYQITYEDYRDCYTTFDDSSGGGEPIFILSDAQILAGQDSEKFSELNYRLDREHGMQKEMMGIVILTFEDDVNQETIDAYVDLIRQHSGSAYAYSLSTIRQNSLTYIFQSLKIYVPVFVCILFFLLTATISANVVMAKRQMRNYVIYYTCGLTWKKCASISLGVSMLLSVVSVILVAGVTAWLALTGKETHLFGLWQILTVAVILIFYNVMAWIVPYCVVRKESAVHIITENNV